MNPDQDDSGLEDPEPDERVLIERDISELNADEVRRRTEAPLPRSLIEFLE